MLAVAYALQSNFRSEGLKSALLVILPLRSLSLALLTSITAVDQTAPKPENNSESDSDIGGSDSSTSEYLQRLALLGGSAPLTGMHVWGQEMYYMPLLAVVHWTTQVERNDKLHWALVGTCLAGLGVGILAGILSRENTARKRLSRSAWIGVIGLLFNVFVGIFAFDSAETKCFADSFSDDGVCKPCRQYMNPLCEECSSTECTKCDGLYEPDGRFCK